MSVQLRRWTVAVAAGIALAGGLTATGPASAAPAPTSPGTTKAGVLGCGWTFSNPYINYPYQSVSAWASTTGCEGIWRFDATLQSSRWYGWHNDVTETWYGDGYRVPTTSCAGVHDHRLRFEANNGLVGYTQYSATETFNCG